MKTFFNQYECFVMKQSYRRTHTLYPMLHLVLFFYYETVYHKLLQANNNVYLVYEFFIESLFFSLRPRPHRHHRRFCLFPPSLTQKEEKPLNASMAFSEKRKMYKEEEGKLTLNFLFVCAHRVEELRKFFFPSFSTNFSLQPSPSHTNTEIEHRKLTKNFLFVIVKH